MSKLKEIREQKGVTQTAVANQLGISRQMYSYYENNPDQLKVKYANDICGFLSCSYDDIFLPEKLN